MPRRISRSFLARPVLQFAPELLGCTIAHTTAAGTVVVRITEVEAYAGVGDPGSHAYRGRPTARTRSLFGPPGKLYVYFTYGMHYCANIVGGRDGAGGAALLRAGEVVEGADLARARRVPEVPRGERPRTIPDRDLARGPARLVVTLGLGRADDGISVLAPHSPVVVRHPASPIGPDHIRCGPRVGVAGPGGDEAAYPWRFWIDGDRTVSTYRPAVPRRRGTGSPAGPDVGQAGPGIPETNPARTGDRAP